ncbi:hypothetical protein HYX17_00100 [Candidatus Woesearchaeota archaeon]|nr:hypothetical protein [Candidatus Woesearchaeota archaeon]
MIVKRSSKAQLGTIEMIMVLVIVIVIVVIGIVFYYNFFLKGIESKKSELNLQEANVLLASLSSIPELQCSFRSVTRECIDMGKAIAFKEVLVNNKAYYIDMFGSKNIKIELLYPSKQEGECNDNKYNSNEYPDNCSLWTLYNNLNIQEKAITSTPVSLYFPITKEFRVGRLIVELKI